MDDSERSSISSGFSVPQWIRSKTDRHDDINFSPPAHDDSFFYIRYPVQESSKVGIKKLSEKIQEENKSHNFAASNAALFSNHTEQCKRFLNESNVDGIKHPPKSFGTDDGFQTNAACGSSIIQVAQRMVSGRSTSANRGFKLQSVDPEETELQLKTVEDQTLKTSSLIQPEPQELEAYQAKNRLLVRRGSKSLPASPAGSPKSMRKFQGNPYFTGTYSLAANNGAAEGRGWFLASLLGIQRENTPSSSVHHIEEEPEEYNTTKNNNNLDPSDSKDLHQKILKAKPSELREMNFWSPTSM